MRTIITGGIGCGKSVVSQLLRVMGHNVYDCDVRARQLMRSNQQLIADLKMAFGTETYLPDGSLNKPFLSRTIFSDPKQLQIMNAIVHPAVARDIAHTQCLISENTNTQHNNLFIETAIYFESHFDALIKADLVWCVVSPLETRIKRIMIRDNATRDQVMARIANQITQEKKIRLSDSVIWNDDAHSIIQQVNTLLSLI